MEFAFFPIQHGFEIYSRRSSFFLLTASSIPLSEYIYFFRPPLLSEYILLGHLITNVGT